MDINWLLTAMATGAAVSFVCSAVLILFGGYGGYLKLRSTVEAVEDDVERLDHKITREVKARAGNVSWRKQAEEALRQEAGSAAGPVPKDRGELTALIRTGRLRR